MKVRLSRAASVDFRSPQMLSDGGRWLICGESGSGKSSCVANISQQVIEGDGQVILLDPHGEYPDLWSAKPSAVCRIGYGDASVTPENIPELLELVEAGTSLLIDLSHWLLKPQEMDAFVLEFVAAVFDLRRKRPRYTFLVVEEAQNFAPQAQLAGQNVNVQLWTQLLSAGRKFGIQCCLASQRISLIDLNVVSQCNARVFLRMSEIKDWKRARQYVPAEMNIRYDDIRHFKSGEALVLTRWFPECRVRLLQPQVQLRKASL